MALDPARAVAELEELRELTGDADGAQRVAWTDTWAQARAWLRDKAVAAGGEGEGDAPGDQGLAPPGAAGRGLLIRGPTHSGPKRGRAGGSLTPLRPLRRRRRD